jgi:DNA modification methylase
MSLPTPYYSEDGITLYCGDCREILPTIGSVELILTDPPYGIGFGYDQHEDRGGAEYVQLMSCLRGYPLAVLQYPEEMMRYLVPIYGPPQEVMAWCYNSNTARQMRLWGFWNVDIDFSRVQVPAKNPTDPRVRPTVSSYDWVAEYQQVKNVSTEKTEHPCQVPEALVRHVIKLTKAESIVDPFAGSGTTLVAAKQLGRKAVGIEISEKYCEIAVKRLAQRELFGAQA